MEHRAQDPTGRGHRQQQEPLAADFRRSPLPSLEAGFAQQGDCFWIPGRQLIVASPDVCKDVLSNRDGLYHDDSDFFRTRLGTFGPRESQEAIGRSFRRLLQGYLNDHQGELRHVLWRLRTDTSDWPDAGNWLIFEHLVTALVGSGEADEERLLRDIVRHAVLAGARQRRSWWRRLLFRRHVGRMLERVIGERRQRVDGSPTDLLQGIVEAVPRGVPAEGIGEVLLSALFATAGSIGFTVGWCFFLLGTRASTDAAPAWVVREALRLWPIAWLLARRPRGRHSVEGETVEEGDQVIVCTYLLHRHPDHWSEAHRFLPHRWAAGQPSTAYLPFGWGRHFCAAASLTLELVESILAQTLDGFWPVVTQHQLQPQVAAALAPPRFTLSFDRRRATRHRRPVWQRLDPPRSRSFAPIPEITLMSKAVDSILTCPERR